MNIHSYSSIAKLIKTLAILALVVLTGIPVTSFAQEVLEEIMVTASRRGLTDIQSTPLSITALDSDTIDKLNLHSLSDVAIMVPNMVYGNAPMFNSFNPSLRGVGKSGIILYVDSPVGVSVDDFVIPHVQTQALQPFDMESIEVLRGPQGTLFGKNTTAGVINVRTKAPKLNERTFEIKGKFGDWDTKEGNYAANYGTDTFAFRAAGIYQKSGGYYRNGKQSSSIDPFTGAPQDYNGDGRRLNGDDVFSGRFKALWEPNEDFSAKFT